MSEEEPQPEPAASESAPQGGGNWVDSIPGVIGRLIRRYGWLYGVYTALAGLGFAVVGVLARVLSRQVLSDPFGMGGGPGLVGGFGGSAVWYDEAGNVIASPFGDQSTSIVINNPMTTMGTVILVIGIVLILAGITLAVCLKLRSGGDKQE